MISDDRMTVFINSLDAGLPQELERLEQKAKQDYVPIIRKDMQALMKFLMVSQRPMKILEVGCAIGFSALLMNAYAPKGCHITTIEKFEKRIEEAKKNFADFQKEEEITLLCGDAEKILQGLDGEFDFIFMDAAKGQYINWLPDCVRLLRQGGMLVSDNVLQDGDIIESRFAVTRRNRTIHSRMREYLYELKHRPDLETVILTIGDGAALSVKK